MPGQTRRTHLRSGRRHRPFNGGPGNCPAKLDARLDGVARLGLPSMEGRAIARPNLGDELRPVVGAHPSMEGRAIARPNLILAGACDGDRVPSMEGRAIARPNAADDVQHRRQNLPSMEGRAIARPNLLPVLHAAEVQGALQWRAGQLPGQTGPLCSPRSNPGSAFNGGPGNCPAKRGSKCWR